MPSQPITKTTLLSQGDPVTAAEFELVIGDLVPDSPFDEDKDGISTLSSILGVPVHIATPSVVGTTPQQEPPRTDAIVEENNEAYMQYEDDGYQYCLHRAAAHDGDESFDPYDSDADEIPFKPNSDDARSEKIQNMKEAMRSTIRNNTWVYFDYYGRELDEGPWTGVLIKTTDYYVEDILHVIRMCGKIGTYVRNQDSSYVHGGNLIAEGCSTPLISYDYSTAPFPRDECVPLPSSDCTVIQFQDGFNGRNRYMTYECNIITAMFAATSAYASDDYLSDIGTYFLNIGARSNLALFFDTSLPSEGVREKLAADAVELWDKEVAMYGYYAAAERLVQLSRTVNNSSIDYRSCKRLYKHTDMAAILSFVDPRTTGDTTNIFMPLRDALDALLECDWSLVSFKSTTEKRLPSASHFFLLDATQVDAIDLWHALTLMGVAKYQLDPAHSEHIMDGRFFPVDREPIGIRYDYGEESIDPALCYPCLGEEYSVIVMAGPGGSKVPVGFGCNILNAACTMEWSCFTPDKASAAAIYVQRRGATTNKDVFPPFYASDVVMSSSEESESGDEYDTSNCDSDTEVHYSEGFVQHTASHMSEETTNNNIENFHGLSITRDPNTHLLHVTQVRRRVADDTGNDMSDDSDGELVSASEFV